MSVVFHATYMSSLHHATKEQVLKILFHRLSAYMIGSLQCPQRYHGDITLPLIDMGFSGYQV